MPHLQRSTLKQRLVPFTAAAVTLGAIVTFSQVTSNLAGGASATPAPTPRAAAAAVAPSETVVVNHNPEQTAAYWTKAKTEGAKAITSTRTDAYSASAGTANLDFARSQISPRSANTKLPYRTTGKLFFTEPGVGDFQCSASVVAKRVVITAAHCMHSGSAFYTNWVFIPGYDGGQSTLAKQRPFGTWVYNLGKINANWISTNGSLPNATDYGALVFSDQAFSGTTYKLSQKAGQYTFAVSHLFDTHVTMLGYPCNFDACNIMQRVDSSDHRTPPGSSVPNVFEYGSDMTGGSSGGPWLENFGYAGSAPPQGVFNTRNAVVGVTSYIYTSPAGILIEGASQLTSAAWTNDIYAYVCAAAAGNC